MSVMLFNADGTPSGVAVTVQVAADGWTPRVIVKDGKYYVRDAEYYQSYRECTFALDPPTVSS